VIVVSGGDPAAYIFDEERDETVVDDWLDRSSCSGQRLLLCHFSRHVEVLCAKPRSLFFCASALLSVLHPIWYPLIHDFFQRALAIDQTAPHNRHRS
jgi:hypothetical protein